LPDLDFYRDKAAEIDTKLIESEVSQGEDKWGEIYF